MIRPASVDDSEQLAAAHIRSWQAAYRGIVPAGYLDDLASTVDRRAEWFRRHIASGAAVHVVDHGEVVGFCTTGISEDGKHCELFAIYVHPDHWNHGHGHALLEAGEQHLATLDHQPAILWVLEGNVRARRFYEAHTWVDSRRSALIQIGGADLTEVRYEKAL